MGEETGGGERETDEEREERELLCPIFHLVPRIFGAAR